MISTNLIYAENTILKELFSRLSIKYNKSKFAEFVECYISNRSLFTQICKTTKVKYIAHPNFFYSAFRKQEQYNLGTTMLRHFNNHNIVTRETEFNKFLNLFISNEEGFVSTLKALKPETFDISQVGKKRFVTFAYFVKVLVNIQNKPKNKTFNRKKFLKAFKADRKIFGSNYGSNIEVESVSSKSKKFSDLETLLCSPEHNKIEDISTTAPNTDIDNTQNNPVLASYSKENNTKDKLYLKGIKNLSVASRGLKTLYVILTTFISRYYNSLVTTSPSYYDDG